MEVKKTFARWEAWEVDVLRRLCASGMSAKKVHQSGQVPRHSEFGISQKMTEAGLGNPEIKERARNALRLPASVKSQLVEFLNGPGREKPNRDVADKFGIKARAVWEYRRQYAFPLPSKVAFGSKHFRERHKHVIKKLRAGLAAYHKGLWQKRRRRLIELFFAQVRRKEFRETMTCEKCQDMWFATPTFFYRAKSRSGSDIRLYYRCRACDVPWRKHQ